MLAPEAIQAAALLELRRRQKERKDAAAATAPKGWRAWLKRWFPQTTSKPFNARMVRLWEWLDSLRPGERPEHPARVEIWPRGGAKSTTAELGVTYVGGQYRRRFALYVCTTQAKANLHVGAIATKLEEQGVGRAVNAYGASRGRRMDMLRVEGGFNVLALGLDVAARGVKFDDFRPDLIIFDDIDERFDTKNTVDKKITTITQSILPSGAPHCAYLVIQNRIHGNSIVSHLANKTADFLHGALVHEEPAVVGLKLDSHMVDGVRRYRIVGGTATWEGQDLATCEEQVNDWGRASFLREAQHQTDEVEGGLWVRERDIDPFREPRPPEHLLRIVVSVDPNTEGEDGNDEAGIIVVASYRPVAGGPLHGVCLADETVPGGPRQWADAAVAAYKRWQANTLVAERNNGGKMVEITIGTVPGAPHVKLIHAVRGKQTRAEPVQKLAEDGRLHHAGVFVELEHELCTWKPGDLSPNRLDAYVHGMTELLIGPPMLMPWSPGQNRDKNGGANGQKAGPRKDAPLSRR